MAITVLLKTSVEPVTPEAFLALSVSAFADITFDETKFLSPGYTAAYGAGYPTIESAAGFRFKLAIELKNDYVDRYGLVAMRLASIEASARFTPTGLTEAEWLALVIPDGADAVIPGQSLAKSNTNLVISAGASNPKVTIYKAGIKDTPLAFGDAHRLGELTWTAKRTWTAGVADPLYLVEIA